MKGNWKMKREKEILSPARRSRKGKEKPMPKANAKDDPLKGKEVVGAARGLHAA